MDFYKYAFRNFVTKVAVSAIALIGALLVPLVTGPSLYGIYAYAVVCIGFLIPLTAIGSGAGIVYLLSSSKYHLAEVLGTQILMALGMALINALLAFLLMQGNCFGQILTHLSIMEQGCFYLAVFCQTISFFAGRILYGISDFSGINQLELVNGLVNPPCILICFFLWQDFGVTFVFVAIACSSLLVMGAYLWRFRSCTFGRLIHKPFLIEVFHYGLKSWLGDLAFRANLRVDQLLLGWFSTPVSLGIYSFAVRLSELVWYLPDSFGSVLFNRLAAMKDAYQKIELLAKSSRVIFWIALLFVLVWTMIIYLVLIPFVFKQSYSEVWMPYLLLIPGTYLLIIYKICSKLFSSSGQVVWTSTIAIAGSFIAVLLNVVLIPLWGMHGAAIASTCAYACMGFIAWWMLTKTQNVVAGDFFIPKPGDWKELKNGILKTENIKSV